MTFFRSRRPVTPPAVPVPPPETFRDDGRPDLAALILFSTPPSDRALRGWCGFGGAEEAREAAAEARGRFT